MHITLELIRCNHATNAHIDDLRKEKYRVSVRADGALSSLSGAEKNRQLDWRKLWPMLEALRSVKRDDKLRKRIGKQLRKFLKNTEWALCAAYIQQSLASKEPIHITIRSGAAEMFLLPWELLHLDKIGQPLGRVQQVSIGHEWPDIPRQTASVQSGRMLMAWSEAGGKVLASQHRVAIEMACQDSDLAFEPERDCLQVTPRGLTRALRAEGRPPVTVLHLLCHGMTHDGKYFLGWRNERGTFARVTAGDLSGWLMPFASTLRLVILCGCSTGDSTIGDRELGSVAQAIHRLGIPWVISSRYPLGMVSAVEFSTAFYKQLLQSPKTTVEGAFADACDQLSHNTERADHLHMQLYAPADMRGVRPILCGPAPTADGKPDTQPPPTKPAARLPIEDVLVDALDLILQLDRTHQWGRLRSLCAASDDSLFMVVFADRSQYVSLFCERILRDFNRGFEPIHQLRRLRFTDQDSTATVIQDWDERLVEALSFGKIDPEKALALATANHPLVLVLGDKPLTDLDAEQSVALAEFVGERLPQLIRTLPPGNQPVRVVVPIEQTATSPGERSPLIKSMDGAAEQARECGIETYFIELQFPTWPDIDAFLQRAVTHAERARPAYQQLVDACRRSFHDIAGRTEDQRDFVELAKALHHHIEDMRRSAQSG